MRAGAHALSLLSVPLNVNVLTALSDGPKPLMELRRAVGMPPPTTMRKHLRNLTEIGVLERHRRSDFPGSVDYSLGDPGQSLLRVLGVLETWLTRSPDGPLEPGSTAARGVVKALVEGWSSTIVRALAARPLSLTDLNRLISTINYPTLERRLSAMRLAGQITPTSCGGRSRPYEVTRWLREAVCPLAVAAEWEQACDPANSTAISRLDIEAAFLLSMPMLRLPADHTGTARLAVQLGRNGTDPKLAGVLVTVDAGRVTYCTARLRGDADSWVSGTVSAWLETIIVGEPERLDIRGNTSLAHALLDRLNGALFGARQAA